VQKASDICKAVKLTKQQLYPSLKRLQSKGIVNSTLEHPARFSVIDFEKVLDLFINAKMEETRSLQQSKAQILSNWQNLKLEDGASAKFTVIEGRNFIYSKIEQMIQETTKQVLAITTIPVLAQADQRDIFDPRGRRHLKSKIQFRFLAELSHQNVHIMKDFFKEKANAKINVEGRNPDLGLTLFPQMFIRDEQEAVFFIKPRMETSIIEQDDVCLWTDCKTLITAFIAVFEELWFNSTDIREKILEIETGKPSPRTFIIGDAEKATKKYNEIVKSAREEVLILTSSEDLLGFWKNKQQFVEWRDKGVTVKIMAPIVSENLEAAKQLSGLSSVKHVPPNRLQTTIVDGKYLFQFKTSIPEKPPVTPSQHFKNTLYTNNPEYVQKTKTMLNEIWKNSSPPSADNLESIFGTNVRSVAYFPGAIRGPGPYGTFHPLPPSDLSKKGDYTIVEIVDEDPFKKLTEQDVLNEIISGQRITRKNKLGKFKVYSSQAVAIIHPPNFFNLPPMLIRLHHIEKHSTFGEENVVMINLWRETTNGYAYVPVAIVVDSPKAQAHWKTSLAGSAPGLKVQLVKKDELQIRVHGNTMFAGWSVPISLLPPQLILPPVCLLVEGYGDVKTIAYTIMGPGGGFTAKQNGFDAFVTFMQPSSKYSGPGTDGLFVRDFVGEFSPPVNIRHPPTMETNLIEKRKP
jgi:sugar-specific transcriptional regulator TrmB